MFTQTYVMFRATDVGHGNKKTDDSAVIRYLITPKTVIFWL